MLDMPLGVLVQKMAPQFASMVPAEKAKMPFREFMKNANFLEKSLVSAKIGPFLPKGVTYADIEKAVNEPPPPPEKPVEVTKPAVTAPAPKPTATAPIVAAPAGKVVSTTTPQPAVPPKPAVAAPPPVAGAPAAAPAAAAPPPAPAPASTTTSLLPQARPAAAGARPAEASAGPWQDYINSHGGHATIVKDGKLVNVPLGTPGQYNNLDPVLGSRLYKAAQAYTAQTGLEPRFNEGTRGNDVQAVHYKNLEGGAKGPVAHPQDANHRGSNHLHGEAFDIPQGPFLNFLHANALKYGLAFPVKNDSVHVELAQGTPRQADYTGGVSPPAAGAPAAGAPAAGAQGDVPDTARYYPKGTDMATVSSIGALAARLGVSPAAIAGVIKTESNWNPQAGTGSYHGLTQMGPDTFKEAGGKLNGLTYDEYLKASPDKQVDTYGAWLDHYGFSDKFKGAKIDLASMTPAQQAAYLQAFQFSPAVSNWIGADPNAPVTHTKQASALGSTSLADMTKYDETLLSTEKGDPATATGGDTTEPAATPAATPAADTPTADAGKHGLGGGMGGFGEALQSMASGMYGGGGAARSAGSAQGPTTVQAAQLPHPPGPISMVDTKLIEAQRQQLAHALQRLNSGKLV